MVKVTFDSKNTSAVPNGLEIAGAYSWRFLVIAASLTVLGILIIELRIIVIPFLVAILIAALLVPLSNWLQRHKFPKLLAVVTSLVGVVATLAGLIYLIISQVSAAVPELTTRSQQAFTAFQTFVRDTLGITGEEINSYSNQAIQSIQENSQFITSGIASFGLTAGHFLAGLLLAIFAVVFFLVDGKNIWNWVVRLFPKRSRQAVDGAGQAGWVSLTSFMKTQVAVAGVDGILIGVGALIIQVPLAIPIAIIVFLGSFIPVVGAIATGIIAVFIALVFNGPISALIMIGIVLLVQQIESNVLQPFLIGKAVEIHPLAIVFGVAIGSLVAGIPGALFAVPIIAVLNTVVTYIARRKRLDTTPSKT